MWSHYPPNKYSEIYPMHVFKIKAGIKYRIITPQKGYDEVASQEGKGGF